MILPVTNPFHVLCISFVGKSFSQLLCPSFSSNGQVQTFAYQEREKMQKQGRSNDNNNNKNKQECDDKAGSLFLFKE